MASERRVLQRMLIEIEIRSPRDTQRNTQQTQETKLKSPTSPLKNIERDPHIIKHIHTHTTNTIHDYIELVKEMGNKNSSIAGQQSRVETSNMLEFRFVSYRHFIIPASIAGGGK